MCIILEVSNLLVPGLHHIQHDGNSVNYDSINTRTLWFCYQILHSVSITISCFFFMSQWVRLASKLAVSMKNVHFASCWPWECNSTRQRDGSFSQNTETEPTFWWANRIFVIMSTSEKPRWQRPKSRPQGSKLTSRWCHCDFVYFYGTTMTKTVNLW